MKLEVLRFDDSFHIYVKARKGSIAATFNVDYDALNNLHILIGQALEDYIREKQTKETGK